MKYLVSCIIAVTVISCAKNNIYKDAPAENPVIINEEWACSYNRNIAIFKQGELVRQLTTGSNDWKPSWSIDGKRLTFFRCLQYGLTFEEWRTMLCVINQDGSGLRMLTSGEYTDFNPTWTRDGSNRIIFTRYSGEGIRYRVYWTKHDAAPGDEQLISEPGYRGFEWAFSALRDGQIIIDRYDEKKVYRLDRSCIRTFLLTPSPGKKGVYKEVKRPHNKAWHKLSVSPEETKVAYMLDNNWDPATYEDVVICYADFDAKKGIISNERKITDYSMMNIHEYPRWSKDGKYIIYDSNRKGGASQLYAYRLSDGVTVRISKSWANEYQFGNFKFAPK